MRNISPRRWRSALTAPILLSRPESQPPSWMPERGKSLKTLSILRRGRASDSNHRTEEDEVQSRWEVLLAEYDGRIMLWQVAGWKPQPDISTADHVIAISFSRDGKWLAAAAKKKIDLWQRMPEERHPESPEASHRLNREYQVDPRSRRPNRAAPATGCAAASQRPRQAAIRRRGGTSGPRSGRTSRHWCWRPWAKTRPAPSAAKAPPGDPRPPWSAPLEQLAGSIIVGVGCHGRTGVGLPGDRAWRRPNSSPAGASRR